MDWGRPGEHRGLDPTRRVKVRDGVGLRFIQLCRQGEGEQGNQEEWHVPEENMKTSAVEED